MSNELQSVGNLPRKLGQTSLHIPCKDVRTLAWDGNELVDITSGRRFRLDATFVDGHYFLGYKFDRGLCLRNADVCWNVAYDNHGTKALLFENGKIHRQLNRDYYFAQSYDYPIALTMTSTGRVMVVHCPCSYDELEFEDAESGETLGVRKSQKMEFHSRLATSPSGSLLVSAGWFWHPLNGVWLSSIGDVVGVKSEHVVDLDFGFGAEIDSAAFLGDGSLVVTSTNEVINPDVPPTGLGPMRLGVWSIADEKWASVVELRQTCGTMMPWRDWVISFHEYPKAIELATGQIVHRWEHIYSGRQIGAIELGTPAPPPLALDPAGGRFAVGGPDGVTVVTLSASS